MVADDSAAARNDPLEIGAVRVVRLSVPMRGSFGSAHHPDFTTMESTVVVLDTVDGVRGVGTADATPGYSVQTHDAIESSLRTDLIPELLARDPAHPNELLACFDAVEGAPNAKCALELAYLDAYCRRRDETLSDLLWGAMRDPVPLNGWVGIASPEEMAEEVRSWGERGFESVKIKLAGEPERDVERVRTVCEAAGGDIDVRADVNAGYTVDEAIHVARSVEPYPLVHLEQPVAKTDLDGLKEVTESTTTPIMADECILTPADALDVIRREAADRIKVKILRMGGVLRTRQVLDAAELAGVECVLGHGFGLTPATSAEVQLAAAHDNVFGPVESVGPLKMADEPFGELLVEDGHAALPDGPGLGTPLAESELDDYVTSSWRVER